MIVHISNFLFKDFDSLISYFINLLMSGFPGSSLLQAGCL